MTDNTLSDIQTLDLDELVGGAEDSLPRAIYDAQVKLNNTRQIQRLAEADLEWASAKALATLYESGEAGKNDRERRINEGLALDNDELASQLRLKLEKAQLAVESAQADLELAQNQFAAVRARARVVSAMLEYAASTGKPLHVEAGQSDRNGIIPDDDKSTVSSNDAMPF